MTHFSQHGQDALVAEVLFPGRRGTFVDVGARDGVLISNTLHLERCGWTGIAIEPHPDLYAALATVRRCQTYNVAASDRPGKMSFVKFLEEPFGNSGLLETFPDPERLAQVKHEVVEVTVATLESITSDMSRIDYLDIDVEGHELQVLKGIDLKQRDIGVIGVECSPGSDKAVTIDRHCADAGFKPFLHLVSDRFYSREVPVIVGRL